MIYRHTDNCMTEDPLCPCVTCAKDFTLDNNTMEGCCDRHNLNCGDHYPCPDYEPETEESVKTESDPVNHPSHYCREGGMESIDEMVAVFGKLVVAHFCLCNVWKYRYRACGKGEGEDEDLRKSDWYMRKYIELTGKSRE